MKRIRGISSALKHQEAIVPNDKHLSLPGKVVLPLGYPHVEMSPLVQVGDRVFAGQQIGEDQKGVFPPLRASISGIVSEIKPWLGYSGHLVLSIVIESQSEDAEETISEKSGDKTDAQDILKLISQAGIRETDDHAWPLALRIARPEIRLEHASDNQSPALAQPIEILIINGMDRQPGISVRSRALSTREKSVLEGIAILQEVSGAKRSILTVYKDYPISGDFEKGLKELGVEIMRCPNKYPIALEPILVRFVTGREVTRPTWDTRMVGTVVVDVITTLRVLEAVRDGATTFDTMVQVSAPSHGLDLYVHAPEGIVLEELLSRLLTVDMRISKAIVGGPFLGYAQQDLQAPITQEIDAVILQAGDEFSRYANHSCISCGYCVRACPMRLLPNELSKNCEYSKFEEAEKADLFSCIECGICAYVCPARRPMVQLIRFGKSELISAREES